MATITIIDTGKKIEATPAVSLLNILLREGIKINHLCGGKALCVTCRVTVREGMRNLSPVSGREQARLEAAKAKPGQRLACQAYIKGDISISIP